MKDNSGRLIVSGLALLVIVVARGHQSADGSAKRAADLLIAQGNAQMTATLNAAGSSSVPVPDIGAATEAVAADPVATTTVVNAFNAEYVSDKANAKSAAQATQAATETSLRLQSLQVCQNARIIALLSKLASKPSSK